MSQFRTAYDGENRLYSDLTAQNYEGETSVVQQNFKDECDINTIMARYEKTGLVPSSPLTPRYGDVSLLPSYHEAQNIVAQANSSFFSLPARIRERFDHNPSQFLAFVSDKKNEAEMVELGLIERLPPENPPKGSDDPEVAL